MTKTKSLITLLAAAVLLAPACSNPKVPGSWIPVDTGTGDAFFSVNFVNESVGWLNGNTDRGAIPYEEEDANANGNRNAARRRPGPKATPKPEDPLKANQGFEVLQTTDGGQTWRQIPDQFKHKIRSVWFVDPQTGWALTIDRDILRTNDGGASWALQRKASTVKLKLTANRQNPVLDQPEQIEHVYFIDSARGWAWGGGRKDEYAEQPGIFLVTVDGGLNWNEVAYPFPQDASDIFFLNATQAWASTMDGSFFKTTDGGLNWTKVQTRLPEDVFRAIFFLDENQGWVIGRSGRVHKTTDGGRTWIKTYLKIKDEYKMRDIFFIDRERGWAVGDGGAMLYTADGGESWVSVGPVVEGDFLDVAFLGERTGWAVGLGGAAVRFEPQ